MLELKEKIDNRLKGEVFLKVINSDGSIILEGHQNNLIVDNGLLVTASLLASDFTDYAITQFAFGDGTTAATSADTNLGGDYFRKIGIDTTLTGVFGNNIARIYWEVIFNNDIAGQTFEGAIGGVWPANTAFTIKEFGLYSTNDTLFNRLIWTGADLILNKGVKIEGFFQITISAN